MDKPPTMKPLVGWYLLRVRSLRTQQRAESQCLYFDSPFVGFFGLIVIESVSSWFSPGFDSSTESLILAQDERWRRA
jgi:hypothetical protein